MCTAVKLNVMFHTGNVWHFFPIRIKVLARALSFHTEDCLRDNVTWDNGHHAEDNLNQLTWSLESSCSEQIWRRCCTLRTLPVPVDNMGMSVTFRILHTSVRVCVWVCVCVHMSKYICTHGWMCKGVICVCVCFDTSDSIELWLKLL